MLHLLHHEELAVVPLLQFEDLLVELLGLRQLLGLVLVTELVLQRHAGAEVAILLLRIAV